LTEARAIARPIVHIGFHKTATSWFQAAVYPHAVSHSYVGRRAVRDTLLGGTAFEFDAATARTALGAGEQRPPLICEEDLSGTLHIGLASGYVAKGVAERIAAALPEAQIVIFVRAQPTAALSWYIQYLREGGTASASAYLFPETHRHIGHGRPFMVPRFDFSQIDYRGLIEIYDALFGRDNVHVYAYEAFAADRRGTIDRMCGELGLELGAVDFDTRPRNDSYRRVLLPFVRVANLLTSRGAPGKRALIHLPYWYAGRKELLKQVNRFGLLGRRPTPEGLLGRQTLDWIAQRFAANNRWLAERMSLDLRPLGYPLDPPAVPVDPPAPPRWWRWSRT
jgi:hypothetical protein